MSPPILEGGEHPITLHDNIGCFYIMEKLAALCIYELLEQTKHKLTREKNINFFRTTQESTRQLLRQLPPSTQNRIFSDSILESLIQSPFFYGNTLISDQSDFSPETAYGIGKKYKSTIEKMHDFIIGNTDQWFEHISLPYEMDVSNYIERCQQKQFAWALPIPEDVCDIISSFL